MSTSTNSYNEFRSSAFLHIIPVLTHWKNCVNRVNDTLCRVSIAFWYVSSTHHPASPAQLSLLSTYTRPNSWSSICRVLVFSMFSCRDFKTQKMQSILVSKKLFCFFFLDQAQSDCNCHRNHWPHFWFALVRKLWKFWNLFFSLEYYALIVKMDFTWWWRGLKMPFSYTFHHYPSEHLLKNQYLTVRLTVSILKKSWHNFVFYTGWFF